MPSETTIVPADVRAAVATFKARMESLSLPDASFDEALDIAMTDALAASDAVRLAGAGDVVERLRMVARLVEARGTNPDTIHEAAALITTLRATIARLVAERDATREKALREAAETARTVMLSGDCSAAEAHGRMAQAIACSDAILALLNGGTTDE